MKILESLVFLSAGLALAGLAGFGTRAPQDPPKPVPAPKPEPAPLPAPKPEDPPEEHRMRDPGASLRISFLPEADKELALKRGEPLAKYLTTTLRRPMEIVPVSSYAEAVAGMAANKIDLIWVDAPHALAAHEATKRRCQPVATTEEDFSAKVYWIANKRHLTEGTFPALSERKSMPLTDLAACKAKFATLSFSFGEKSSLSGHLMPRYFLEAAEVGIDPERGFKSKPAYAGAGGTAKLIADVGSGALDLAVVEAGAWEAAKGELQADAPVVYVSPEFLRQCFVIHYRAGPTFPLRLMKAFITLKPENPEHKPVLEMFGTQKFRTADLHHLEGLRAVSASAKERGLLE